MVLKWLKSAWIKIRKKCNLGKQPYLSQTLISTILNFVQMGMKPLFTDIIHCTIFPFLFPLPSSNATTFLVVKKLKILLGKY